MGIIKTRSIKATFITIIGFFIGVFNTVFLFPRYFTTEEFGLTRIFYDLAYSMLGITMLGVPQVLIKFYPHYSQQLPKRKNDLLGLSLLISFFGLAFFWIIVYLFEPFFISFFVKSKLFIDYKAYFALFTAGMWLYLMLSYYLGNLHKNLLVVFFSDIFFRIYIIVGFIIFIWMLNNGNAREDAFKVFMRLYAILFYVIAAFYLAYLIITKNIYITFKQSFITKRIKKHLLNFWGYNYGFVIISFISLNISTIMIAGISGLRSTALFAMSTFIISVIQIPYRAIAQSSIPVISSSWKKGNIRNIKLIYHKSSINLTVLSLAALGLIVINIDTILRFLPSDYSAIKTAVIILGISKVIDVSFGINTEILSLSKYWKFNFISNCLLLGITLFANYYFISQYGLIGSVLAILITTIISNIVRFIFLLQKMHYQPFSLKHAIAYLGAVSLTFIIYFYGLHMQYLLDAIINSCLFMATFFITLYYFHVSDDVNEMSIKFYRRFFDKA